METVRKPPVLRFASSSTSKRSTSTRRMGLHDFQIPCLGFEFEEDIRTRGICSSRHFADAHYRFLDLEEKYDLEDALRLGEQMDEELFVWLEGPIRDELLVQYGELRGKLAIQIES